ncbi:MAG: CBS domain-containing protein [Clostridiales bacterium]|jgi:CBS domain-containing protein|nr:CBS domain-containing protein [Clostridiales bacterium]
MQVKELMRGSVITVDPGDAVSSAARLLYKYNIGALPVCSDDGRIKGIVTDRDIVLRCVAAEADPEKTPIREIMTRNVVTVSPSDDVREATRLMATDQIRRLPVVDEGKVVGMLSLGDISKSHNYSMEASKALTEISSNVNRK